MKAAKKDKPAVAAIIVRRIREKDGRFLKRVDLSPNGQVLWVDIGDEKAKEKTCQALREGAPDVRRMRTFSPLKKKDGLPKTEENHHLYPSTSKHERSSRGSFDEHDGQYSRPNSTNSIPENHTPNARSDDSPNVDMFIKPIPYMVVGRAHRRTLPVEKLPEEERERYLLDFIPPHHGTSSCGNRDSQQTVPSKSDGIPSSTIAGQGINPSSVVKV